MVTPDACMNLMRSVPRDFKGGVRDMVNYGWKMYKLNELTPNKTRRAQVYIYMHVYAFCVSSSVNNK